MKKIKQLRKDLNILPKIAIILDGGIIQNILVSDKDIGVEVYSVDYDIEGYDGDVVTLENNEEAIVYKKELDYHPDFFKYLK
jgi:hypothetical protein